ncbi:MAG: hypothetical protein U0470_11535 [Anaerolineae bacterium]
MSATPAPSTRLAPGDSAKGGTFGATALTAIDMSKASVTVRAAGPGFVTTTSDDHRPGPWP